MDHSTKDQKENPFINILFNIILPVVLLEQLTRRLGENGPTIALLVALAFPISYGIYDWLRRHQKNWLSVLGVVNILFTGGLALLHLEGIWFAVKEAAFPLLLGIAVFATTFTRKPFMETLACNPQLLNMSLIQDRLRQLGKEKDFHQHLVRSTYWLTLSFMTSSLLNFVLASRIFKNLDPALSDLERTSLLNDQIAQMTWLSFVVIMLPLMVFMMLIMWNLISGIRRITGLDTQEIFAARPH